MLFFDLIKDNRKKLNDNEENILKYIFASKDKLKTMTVKDIADANYTVPNSIIRICKKLGFGGFLEFREAFLAALFQSKTIMNISALDEQIIKTKQLINKDIINRIIDMIHTSNKIVFFAVGLSRLVAEDLYLRLKYLGKNALFFTDRHAMKHNAKLLSSNDLVFSISISGTTETPIEATSIAKISGAVTVSITGFSNNTLSQITDYQLYAMTSEMSINDIDVAGRLSLMYIVNHIFNEYAKKYLQSIKNEDTHF